MSPLLYHSLSPSRTTDNAMPDSARMSSSFTEMYTFIGKSSAGQSSGTVNITVTWGRPEVGSSSFRPPYNAVPTHEGMNDCFFTVMTLILRCNCPCFTSRVPSNFPLSPRGSSESRMVPLPTPFSMVKSLPMVCLATEFSIHVMSGLSAAVICFPFLPVRVYLSW